MDYIHNHRIFTHGGIFTTVAWSVRPPTSFTVTHFFYRTTPLMQTDRYRQMTDNHLLQGLSL